MAEDPQGGTPDDQVSEETLMVVAHVRSRAIQTLAAAEATVLAADALTAAPATPGRDMTPDEIRHLAASAIDQARQVSYLLGKLAGLLDEPEAQR